MRVSTRIDAHELPDRFRRLFEISPEDQWHSRAKELVEHERRNPFLGEYFDDKYSIERSLSKALAYQTAFGRFPSVRANGGRYYELYSFVHIVACVYERLSPRGQARVRGILRDGLTRDVGLAPFAHEMAMAAHLWTNGFDVEFTDIEGHTQFDLLAHKEGIELEVDCKTASGDIGRSIHRRRALEFFHRIRPAIDTQLKKGGGHSIGVVLAGSLHDDAGMSALSDLVLEAVAKGAKRSVDGLAEVIPSEFDLRDERLPESGPPTSEHLAQLVDRRFGHPHAHAILRHRPEEAAVLVAIMSNRPDRLVDGIYRSLKSGAESQFSAEKPALLAVRLTDLTMPQLADLATQKATGLAAISNRLLARNRRTHLFGVAFVAPDQSPMEAFGAGSVDFHNRGMALLFLREEHLMSKDPRLRIFPTRSASYDSN